MGEAEETIEDKDAGMTIQPDDQLPLAHEDLTNLIRPIDEALRVAAHDAALNLLIHCKLPIRHQLVDIRQINDVKEKKYLMIASVLGPCQLRNQQATIERTSQRILNPLDLWQTLLFMLNKMHLVKLPLLNTILSCLVIMFQAFGLSRLHSMLWELWNALLT